MRDIEKEDNPGGRQKKQRNGQMETAAATKEKRRCR
jgi:hypothetical protein